MRHNVLIPFHLAPSGSTRRAASTAAMLLANHSLSLSFAKPPRGRTTPRSTLYASVRDALDNRRSNGNECTLPSAAVGVEETRRS